MTFKDYLNARYPKGGTASSYIVAVRIIDDMLAQDGKFQLDQSIADITDNALLKEVSQFVCNQQREFKKGNPSIFANVSAKQQSYPSKGFCSAAMKKVIEYRESYEQVQDI